MSKRTKITASNDGQSLTLFTAGDSVTASATSRTLAGVVVRFGVPGHTSRGKLKVAPGALEFPEDLGRVKLTREHDRADVRGHLAVVDIDDTRIRASLRVSDGPEGDTAIREASDRTRDGLSFDIVDATIVGDTITAGRVVAIGQVGIPAYDDGRIDTVAASNQEGNNMLTDEQRARFEELLGRNPDELTDEEREELNGLVAILQTVLMVETPAAEATASAPQQVAASMPAVPAGLASPAHQAARTRPRASALDEFCQSVTAALRPGGGGVDAITAAFTDATGTEHAHTEAPAWSGELWSGLQYEPVFTSLLNSGDLTSWSGSGWRWVTKPAMQDYAGDKTAVPSNELDTEPGSYTAARMAVGHDIDRKFYDFPGGDGFLKSYAEAAREDWAVKLDAKVEAYIIANTVASGVAPGAGGVLTRLGRLLRTVQRRRLGRTPFVILNDNDFDRLLDVTNDDLPAFMDLFNIDASRIVPSANVPADLAIAGAKQAATVRTLPGSPIRVDAQHLANGGVDSAFFGYWAIEEHHTSGILSMDLGYVA